MPARVHGSARGRGGGGWITQPCLWTTVWRARATCPYADPHPPHQRADAEVRTLHPDPPPWPTGGALMGICSHLEYVTRRVV